MAKTRGGHSFKPRVRPSPPPPANATIAPIGVAAPAAGQNTPPAAAAASSHAFIPDASTPRRYDTRVGPTPSSPPHLGPSRRAAHPKRAWILGPGESSSLRPQEPHSPPVQGPADDFSLDMSPTFIIRRSIFHCCPITGNLDFSTKEVHNKTYYDFLAFAADPKLRDSMRLVQRYSLEHFMTPRRFFYPRVVIEFYHTMTSRRVPHPTAIHFCIDGREGTLRVADITATFNFPIVLANSADYRLWPYPSPREMVNLLSRDTTAGSILFRR